MTQLSLKEDTARPFGFRVPAWSDLSIEYRFFSFVVALVFSIYLATRPLLEFKDRNNYLLYFQNAERLLQVRLHEGFISAFSNEPLWLFLVKIGNDFLGPELGLRVLISLPAFIVFIIALRFGPENFFWILIFLLTPMVLTNHVIHLRQGLALSFFMVGYVLIRKRIPRVIVLCLCPFIHSSFFFIILLLLVSSVIRIPKIRAPFAVGIVLLSCAAIAFFLPALLDLTEARQASSLEAAGGGIGGFGFIFWSMILLLILTSGGNVIKNASFPISVLAFYCTTYFVFKYSGRVLESGLLLVLLSLLNLPKPQKYLAFLATLFFFVITWYSRIGAPGLGWGI